MTKGFFPIFLVMFLDKVSIVRKAIDISIYFYFAWLSVLKMCRSSEYELVEDTHVV